MHTGLNALHNFSFLTFSASGSTRVSNGTKLLFESKFKVMCCFLVTIKKSSKIWHFFTYFRLYFGHFKKGKCTFVYAVKRSTECCWISRKADKAGTFWHYPLPLLFPVKNKLQARDRIM